MADLLADIGSLLGPNNGITAKNSTSRKGNTELNMEDFLNLMIVQLTSQTIDDTMDTSEMMNQMVQMQMITAINNLNDTSIQSYANSLVGKVVTVGIVQGNTLEERELVVMGTGTYNGQQVIFASDGNMYYLNQIMAVGRMPNADGTYGPQDPGDMEDPDVKVDPDLFPEFGRGPDPEDPDPDFGIDTEDPEDVTPPGGGDNNDDTVTGGSDTENPEYGGENGVPTE